jgi:hypothetical protein
MIMKKGGGGGDYSCQFLLFGRFLYEWVLLREGHLTGDHEPKGVLEPQENPKVQEPAWMKTIVI